MTITAHVELHAVGHTSRDLDIYDLFAEDDALAVAMRTTVLDLLARTVTIRTDGLCLHSAKEAIYNLYDTATALTLRAGIEVIAVLGTCALTVLALDIFLDLDVLLDTIDDIGQGNLDTYTDVRSALACWLIVAREERAETAAASTASEEAVENIERIKASTSTAKAAHARIVEAELVVTLTLLWVAEHLVGLSALLEFLLGGLVARILVGVIFDSELTIGSLDFIV